MAVLLLLLCCCCAAAVLLLCCCSAADAADAYFERLIFCSIAAATIDSSLFGSLSGLLNMNFLHSFHQLQRHAHKQGREK